MVPGSIPAKLSQRSRRGRNKPVEQRPGRFCRGSRCSCCFLEHRRQTISACCPRWWLRGRGGSTAQWGAAVLGQNLENSRPPVAQKHLVFHRCAVPWVSHGPPAQDSLRRGNVRILEQRRSG